MQRQTNFQPTVSDRWINTISDLITEDRKFLRWSQARDKYQLSNKDIMKRLGLIESMNRDWKSVIKNDSNGFSRTYSFQMVKTIPLQAVTSRIAYTLLTKQLIEKPTAQKSISELLGTSDIN